MSLKIHRVTVFRLTSVLGNFSILRVDFVLKRHMGYYILQVYVPSSMLVMLSWVSFFIHREATADRVNIGVMTVLSLATLSFDIRNYTAAVSYLTALDWFVFMTYAFLLASLLQFAFVHYFTKVRPPAVCFHLWSVSVPKRTFSLAMANHFFAIESPSIASRWMKWAMEEGECRIWHALRYFTLHFRVRTASQPLSTTPPVCEAADTTCVDSGFVYPVTIVTNVLYVDVPPGLASTVVVAWTSSLALLFQSVSLCSISCIGFIFFIYSVKKQINIALLEAIKSLFSLSLADAFSCFYFLLWHLELTTSVSE